MKEYQYEGRTYVESGEVRVPVAGEVVLLLHDDGSEWMPYRQFDSSIGGAVKQSLNEGKRKILIPKEEAKMEEEYNIPVLVKADCTSPEIRGKVLLTRISRFNTSHPYKTVDGRNFSKDTAIICPSENQIQEEQAKLKAKAKADALPAPVRDALKAADLGCRRDGVEKLIEAIYAHPPKAEAAK